MSKKKSIETQFFTDLRKLQAKYPMCTIDAWTPNDYEFALAQEADEPDVELSDFEDGALDWDDDLYKWASHIINKRKDANSGINWQFLAYVLEDLHND